MRQIRSNSEERREKVGGKRKKHIYSNRLRWTERKRCKSMERGRGMKTSLQSG